MHEHYGPSAYPTEVAGAEQYDHRVKDADVLLLSGYVPDAVTQVATPICGPIAVSLPNDAILFGSERRTHLRGMASDKYAHRGGQDAADLDLEQAANALLSFHYGDAMTLDVMREVTRPDGVTSGWDSVAKADRVAHRGKARYQLRSHRYARVSAFIVAGDGTCTDHRGVTYVLGQPLRFVGHKAIHGTTTTLQSAARKATRQSVRGKATGTRGKAVSAIDAGASTIRRVWKTADATMVATAEQIESILRTAGTGATVSIDASHVVTVHAATVDAADGRTFTIREYARRAALNGASID